MAGNVTACLQTHGRTAELSIQGATITDKAWLADALLDVFAVEDAYYSLRVDRILLQNWSEKDPIDANSVRSNIVELLNERGFNVISL